MRKPLLAAAATALGLLAAAPAALAGDQSAIGVSDPSITEGSDGVEELTFSVFVDCVNDADGCEVAYATRDESATAPADYEATSGTLAFTSGAGVQQVTVSVHGDTEFEAAETVGLDAAITNAVPSPASQGSGTIVNDDPEPTVSPPPVDSPTTPPATPTGGSPDASQPVTPPDGRARPVDFFAETSEFGRPPPHGFKTKGAFTQPVSPAGSSPRAEFLCEGKVRVQYRKGSRVIASDLTKLRLTAFPLSEIEILAGLPEFECRFESRMSVALPTPRPNRLVVRTRFLGNDVIRPADAPETVIRPSSPSSCKARSTRPGRGNGPGRSC